MGVSFLLAVITLVVFEPVVRCGFVNYDDPSYVTANPQVQGGLTWDAVAWAFRTGDAGNWHPLTWISLMLDAQFFGGSAGGFHAVSLLFHVANTVLLFVVLRQFTGALWRSAFVAALFALHPLHVESVAWVSERKDLLSTFFALLTLWSYARFVQEKSRRHFWLALFFFALGLMSKPMLVTLPFVLLLLDFWPLQRFSLVTFPPATFPPATRFSAAGWFPFWSEKIPFFLLSLVSCVVTYIVQAKGGTIQSLAHFSMGERLENAVVAYARYLRKMFWPENLAVYYPHPAHWPPLQVAGAAILVAGLSLGVLWSGRRFPFAVTGWFWFFGMLVPVSGLVQAGDQAMADRYTYFPLVGVFILLAWGADELFTRWRLPKPVIGITAGMLLIICAARTADQLRYWQDGETLFRHALAVTPPNYLAENNLGDALLQKGQVTEAMAHFQTALTIEPDCLPAERNLASALIKVGRPDQAMAHYQRALEIQPADAEAHNNLANLLKQQGQLDAAVIHYQKALETQPDDAKIHHNLAGALLGQGLADEAIVQYQKALDLNPNLVDTRHDLGVVLAQKGRVGEAVVQFQKVLEIQPDNAEAHNNLANALLQQGRMDEAVVHYQRALEIHPDDATVQNNLGHIAWLLATSPDATIRNGAQAVALAQQADQLSGGKNPVIIGELAAACAEAGRFSEAITNAQRALQLAGGSNDPSLAASLQGQLKFYQAHSPFRDPGPTP
jgi:protein O-mannosyl-transferase